MKIRVKLFFENKTFEEIKKQIINFNELEKEIKKDHPDITIGVEVVGN